MFSSTSAVSSAIRCWTSCSAGPRAAAVARGATSTTNGTGRERAAPRAGLQREHRGRGEQDRQRALQDEDRARSRGRSAPTAGRRWRATSAGRSAGRRRTRARASADGRRAGCAGRTSIAERDLARDEPARDGQRRARSDGHAHDQRRASVRRPALSPPRDLIDGPAGAATGSPRCRPSPAPRARATRRRPRLYGRRKPRRRRKVCTQLTR